MTQRRFSLTLISALGVAHFVIGLGCWVFLLGWLFPRVGVGIWQLPKQAMLEAVVIPFTNCVVLLAAFLFALRLSLRESRQAELALWLTALLTAIAFLIDTEWSFAQIHKFGPPGTNHFFATWPVYSTMPYLTWGVRLLIVIVGVMGLSWILWHYHVNLAHF